MEVSTEGPSWDIHYREKQKVQGTWSLSCQAGYQSMYSSFHICTNVVNSKKLETCFRFISSVCALHLMQKQKQHNCWQGKQFGNRIPSLPNLPFQHPLWSQDLEQVHPSPIFLWLMPSCPQPSVPSGALSDLIMFVLKIPPPSGLFVNL